MAEEELTKDEIDWITALKEINEGKYTHPTPKVEGDAYQPAAEWYIVNAALHAARGFQLLSSGRSADAMYRFCIAGQCIEDAPIVRHRG